MGGNAGIQTSTVVVRSLALGRISGRDTGAVVVHELTAGLLMGMVTGIAVATVALLWRSNAWLGLIVGTALLGNTLVGVAAGVLIPMSLDRLGQDPALSSGIWLTTFTDVLGFSIFLGLGTLLLTRVV
jgi:magnesium transporter